jgi:hypothetical protein
MAALMIVSGIVIEHQRNPIMRSPAATLAVKTPPPETMKALPGPTMQARNTVPDELPPPARQYSSDAKKEHLKKTDDTSRVAPQLTRTLPRVGSRDRDLTNLAQAAPQSPPLKGVPRGEWPAAPGAVAKAAAPAPAASRPQSAASSVPQSQTVEVTAAAPLVQGDKTDMQGELKGANPIISSRNAAGLGANGLSLAKRTVAPSWRISTAGRLERSTSPGEWTPVLSEQPVAFRAVASIGNDVWAGGSDGALFHSSDAGEHWTKVALVADGEPEQAVVRSIHFDTPAEGRVTTDAGTTWSTLDGGKTWTRP